MDLDMIPLQKVEVTHIASAVTPSVPAITPIISPVHETDLSKGVEKCTTDTIKAKKISLLPKTDGAGAANEGKNLGAIPKEPR